MLTVVQTLRLVSVDDLESAPRSSSIPSGSVVGRVRKRWACIPKTATLSRSRARLRQAWLPFRATSSQEEQGAVTSPDHRGCPGCSSGSERWVWVNFGNAGCALSGCADRGGGKEQPGDCHGLVCSFCRTLEGTDTRNGRRFFDIGAQDPKKSQTLNSGRMRAPRRYPNRKTRR